MGRWQPNGRGRLEQAAMELFSEQGFETTTVAEIANRAGLTERTFFRHFADKREVLFSGAAGLRDYLVKSVEEAPGSFPPIEVIVTAFVDAATVIFEERRDFARRRQAIIAGNAELQERELIKLATLASALSDGLRRRGVADPGTSLAAEAGIAVFKIAFERWTGDTSSGPLSQIIRESADELKTVTSGTKRPRR